MKVRDVITKYHKKIPFPWTPSKIEKAGYEPSFLLKAIGRELEQCVDIGTQLGKRTIAALKELDK